MNAATPTQHICSKCELELPANLPEILCPRCALREFEISSKPFDLPRSFGNYELLEAIGRGGMGVVYRARQIALDRIVAVKVVLQGSHATPEVLRRFLVEARACGKLRHCNLISVHEVGTHEGHSFLVMDFVDGLPLSRLLLNGPLPPRRAAAYTISIARAVAHVHAHGVMHRDLKPSNILIDSNDEVRVTDFGLARTLDEDSDLTLSGQVLGSPNYMSPEQACGDRDRVTAGSDIYSIGAVLYHQLTGRPPFVAPTILETLRSVVHTPPQSIRTQNPAVPPDLETICLKCLAKEPRDRYSSAIDLADDLERFLRFEPIRGRSLRAFERTIRWCRRNPSPAALISVLTLGSLLLGAALYLANEERLKKIAAIQVIATRLGRNLTELWKLDEKLIEVVSSEELAALAGNHKKVLANAVRLQLGIKSPDSPDLQKLHQPLLHHLEQVAERELREPVRFDLVLSKKESRERMDRSDQNIMISRMGAIKYLGSIAERKPFVGFVQEIAVKKAAIFVHRDSPIHHLSQLKGASIALADDNSTITVWAKEALLNSGLTSRDVAVQELTAPDSPNLEKTHSHAPCIEAVLARRSDAGVARSKYVNAHPELRIIHTFYSTPNIWVISRRTPPRLLNAVQSAFLSAKNRALLQSGPTEIDGFTTIDQQGLRALALADERVTCEFDHP